MPKDTFKSRIEANAAKHSYSIRWEDLRYGARRAVVDTVSRVDHSAKLGWVKRIRNVHVEDHVVSSPYAFTGHIHIMDANEWEKFEARVQAENEANLAWYERYHAAIQIIGRERAGVIADKSATVEEAVNLAVKYRDGDVER